LSVVYAARTVDLHSLGLVAAEGQDDAALRLVNPVDPTLIAEPATPRQFRGVTAPLADPIVVLRDVQSGPDAEEAAAALEAALPDLLGWPA
jgi:hypothetical protein